MDLHTATYYTLARTRNQGLAGFCEGAELLAAMIIHEWDKFWPQSGPARTEMLDWFNTRTGNILRQQVSFSENDLSLLYRTERALQLICDKLQQVELKRQPRVENLLYFVQNTRKRFEPQPRNRTDTAAQTMVRTLVYAPEGTASATAETMPPTRPAGNAGGVRGVADNADKAKQGDTVKVLLPVPPVLPLSHLHSGGGRRIRCSSSLHRSGIPHRSRHRLVGIPGTERI